TGTHVINGARSTLPYHVSNDFVPISLLTDSPFLVVAKKAMPPNDLKGLIDWLKVNPNRATAGIAGVGSIDHAICVLFQTITGTQFRLVPYRGSAPAIQDLAAGQIDIAITDLITTLPQVRGGTIKAYAVAGGTRLAV